MTTAPPGWTFDTVLVANRGEIARRIIRTARRLGLRTVAVCSEADLAAPHVREADGAVLIGPASAGESYLNADAILAAAARTGAGAIHPGYGFLSENADFARRVESAGLAFVGPTAAQLEAFGVKHTARALAQAVGVPVLPGTGLLRSAQEAVAEAAGIGFPVMVKATGGGGGIGMLACADEPAAAAAFTRVQRLAAANFSSGGVFLERLVRPARHVEVQIFGDGNGAVVVLGDRDCSLQRRNQKVIEEAPAPCLPADLRARLHEAARALAASVRYRSAGTVEFVYDPVQQEASFLEVNARLQVEHPVTEQVFGLDLVEQMLRLAGLGPASVASLLATTRSPAVMRSRPASTPRTRITAAAPALAWSPRSTGRAKLASGSMAGSGRDWRCRSTTTPWSARSSPTPLTVNRRWRPSARRWQRLASMACRPISACCVRS